MPIGLEKTSRQSQGSVLKGRMIIRRAMNDYFNLIPPKGFTAAEKDRRRRVPLAADYVFFSEGIVANR